MRPPVFLRRENGRQLNHLTPGGKCTAPPGEKDTERQMGLGIVLVKRDTERDIYKFLQNGRAHFPAKKIMRDW